MGISTPEGEAFARSVTPIRIGRSRTTMGVLLTNALKIPLTSRVSRSENCGLIPQTRARARPTGSSAPVRTRPCPAIIRAHTATRASCPNPVKKSIACNLSPSET